MTTPAAPEKPPVDTAGISPVTSVADLIPAPGSEEGAGDHRAPTAAGDAAEALRRGAQGSEGTAPSPEIGKASARARAGFTRKKSKEELIQAGRELADRAAAMEVELAALKGAPEGGTAGTELAPVNPDELVQPLAETFRMVSGVLAAWRGDYWAFTDDELTKLGGAWAPVLAKHAPALGEHATLIMAGMITAGVALPRLRQDRLLEEQKAKGS